ncbi:unnamed protein product [Haemonchus placei]|uniref:Uncharacterized protein n=1 Tax=Haemonchus placei TaxID=6290 RepID=A0A3P7WSY8_HAEPC|nr:unnamed protein product [Haemonchus placei]
MGNKYVKLTLTEDRFRTSISSARYLFWTKVAILFDRSRSPDFDRNEALRESWAALKTQPNNFDAWITLLTQADQSNDVRLARDMYDRFLSKYPYCYGFWKKYADMERRHQNFSDALNVWERGILAIPLSIDLWLGCTTDYYFVLSLYRLYDRALSMAGYEFHSDRLWQDYIAWEEAQGEWHRVAAIYDRLIRIPTAMYKSHMERYVFTFTRIFEIFHFLTSTIAKKLLVSSSMATIPITMYMVNGAGSSEYEISSPHSFP